MTARECTRALNEARLRSRPGLRSRLVCLANTAGVEARIAALALMSWWARARRHWPWSWLAIGGRPQPLQPPVALSAA